MIENIAKMQRCPIYHILPPSYLLALPVSLSFPLALLLTPGKVLEAASSLGLALCCPPPEKHAIHNAV